MKNVHLPSPIGRRGEVRTIERVIGLETEQREIQATGGEIPQQAAPQQAPQSVGTMLKAERERQGLSREQITEKTRMRTQIVEAIENEAWGSLPPPVFVRGFLRAYAKVLGISQEAVIELYVKGVPSESPGQVPPLEPSRNRRRKLWLALVLLVVLAALYGVWLLYPSFQVSQGSRETEKRDQEVASQNGPAEKKGSPSPSEPAVQSPSPVRPAEEPVKHEAAPVQSPSQEAPPGPKEVESPARDRANEGDGWLSLTGSVKERTWLRITIDGKEEKEYLFQAGSKPQWRGKQSFYMIIGNAGGIDFDLNGKRVGDLGKPGQVIRLTLPKDVGQRERAN
jgi:cytoskeleton protein RodZ